MNSVFLLSSSKLTITPTISVTLLPPLENHFFNSVTSLLPLENHFFNYFSHLIASMIDHLQHVVHKVLHDLLPLEKHFFDYFSHLTATTREPLLQLFHSPYCYHDWPITTCCTQSVTKFATTREPLLQIFQSPHCSLKEPLLQLLQSPYCYHHWTITTSGAQRGYLFLHTMSNSRLRVALGWGGEQISF